MVRLVEKKIVSGFTLILNFEAFLTLRVFFSSAFTEYFALDCQISIYMYIENITNLKAFSYYLVSILLKENTTTCHREANYCELK